MTLPVLVAFAGSPIEAALVSGLAARGSGLTVARRCVDVTDLLAALGSVSARAVLVGANLPRLDRDVVARVHSHGMSVIGVAVRGDDLSGGRLAAVGVDAVVQVDPAVPPTTGALIARAVADAEISRGGSPGYSIPVRPATAPASPDDAPDPAAEYADDHAVGTTSGSSPRCPTADRPGALVTVWGPHGSPGRSTVAIALADEAARAGLRTLLIDADTHGPALAAMLGVLDDVPGILLAARAAGAGTLDAAGLVDCAVGLGPGLGLVTGLPRPDRWPELRPAALQKVLDVARTVVDLVIVDAGPGADTDEELAFDVMAPRRNGSALVSLAEADLVLVVGAAEPVALLRLVQALDSDAGTGALAEASQWRLVLTRMRESALGSAPEQAVRELLDQHLGNRLDHDPFVIPDDRAAFDAALLAGLPVGRHAPNSPARKALRELAALTIATVRPQPDKVRTPRRRPRVLRWRTAA